MSQSLEPISVTGNLYTDEECHDKDRPFTDEEFTVACSSVAKILGPVIMRKYDALKARKRAVGE
jgi:hypothetical protein